MMQHFQRRICMMIALGALLAPVAFADAGDSPYLVIHGWGVGEIDGKIMFYMGDNAAITPIPAPTTKDVGIGICDVCVTAIVIVAWAWHRRQSQNGDARRGFEFRSAMQESLRQANRNEGIPAREVLKDVRRVLGLTDEHS